MKTLLIVSGGLEAVPGIQKARELGLHVVVSDGNPEAPGFAVSHDHIVASTYDIAGTVEAAGNYHKHIRPIDGVMCVAADVPLTVASVASSLGLPGIPIASAKLAMDKMAMKSRFMADGIPVPWFSAVDSVSDLRQVIGQRGFPMVLKPVDSRGARGVLRLTEAVDIAWAFGEAVRHSPTERVMVEEFLTGSQISTESLVIDGYACTPGFSDRNYEFLDRFAPHMIENGGDLPSELPAGEQQAVRELVARAAASMGIRNGVAKGDVVVRDGEPYVIELAARLSGGYFCTHEIPLNTGVDLVGTAIRMALGERVDTRDLEPRYQRFVCQRYLFPEPGRVVDVSGHKEVEQWEGIAMCQVRVRPGDVLRSMDSHPARAGVVIATGGSREAAAERARAAVAAIRIETVN